MLKQSRLLLLTLLGLSAPMSALAEKDTALDDENYTVPGTKRCLSLTRISSIRILDNQRLAFDLSGKKMYLNILPRPCPGLRKDSIIMYRTSLSQLCDLDIITVLDSIGGGFMPGPSCGLGKFVPTTKDELKPMRYEEIKTEPK